MSDLTCNSAAVLSAEVFLPRVGAWVSQLVLDTETIPSDPIVIESTAGLRLVGSVERADSTEGRVELRVRGGAGNLKKVLPPVGYRPSGGVRVDTILTDLARDSGEKFTASTEIAETYLDAWVRERGTVAGAIRALAVQLGCSWRVLPSGRVVLIRETWPTVDPMGAQLIKQDPYHLGMDVAVDVLGPEFMPGVIWQGRRVDSVELYLLKGGAHRVRLLLEDPINETLLIDRMAMTFKWPDEYATEKTAFDATYTGRIVSQSADLATVDVELEPDVPTEKRVMPGLVSVPLYGSVPGMVLDLGASANEPLFCLVEFANRDRMKPFVAQWKSSPRDNSARSAAMTRLRGAAIQLGDGNARKVARDTDPVGPNAAMTTWMTDISARVSALTGQPPGPVGNPATLPAVTPPVGTIATIAGGSPFVKTD